MGVVKRDSNWQQKEKGADLLTMLSSTSLVALTCLTTATAAPAGNSAAAPTKNIAELAIATPDLSTLLAAVKAAGLVETLAGDVPEGDTKVKTAGGEEITVSRTRYLKIKSSVAKTGVAAFDILATNGVVHLINDVI